MVYLWDTYWDAYWGTYWDILLDYCMANHWILIGIRPEIFSSG